MNIRKIMVLMMVALFVCSAAAYAAGSLEVCDRCKSKLGHVPLITKAQTACGPFDYDGTPVDSLADTFDIDVLATGALNATTQDFVPNHPTQAYGYCAPSGPSDPSPNENYNERMIFQICNCSTSALTRFNTVGAKISIRMTILTNGVYWSNSSTSDPTGIANPTVSSTEYTNPFSVPPTGLLPIQPSLDINGTYESTDATDTDGLVNGAVLPEIRFEPYSSLTTACAAVNPNLTRTFGGIKYYYLDANGARVAASPATGGACSLTPAQRATILESFYGSAGIPSTWDGYNIRQSDKDRQVSAWMIDVPPMRLDNTIAKMGDSIKVRVEMLDPGSAGICQACLPICSCDFEIGIIGCTGGTSTCTFFPYVVTQAGAWGTGIAIANTDSRTITNPTLTFTLTDSKGAVCTATLPFADKVGAWMLDDPKLVFTPKPTAGAAMLKVSGNFILDGYHFMTNGEFGAGVLPRTSCP